MAHAQICPVCGGKGKIPKGGNTTDAAIETFCNGCSGKGWVEVQDAPVVFPSSHYCPYALHCPYPAIPTITDGSWSSSVAGGTYTPRKE